MLCSIVPRQPVVFFHAHPKQEANQIGVHVSKILDICVHRRSRPCDDRSFDETDLTRVIADERCTDRMEQYTKGTGLSVGSGLGLLILRHPFDAFAVQGKRIHFDRNCRVVVLKPVTWLVMNRDGVQDPHESVQCNAVRLTMQKCIEMILRARLPSGVSMECGFDASSLSVARGLQLWLKQRDRPLQLDLTLRVMPGDTLRDCPLSEVHCLVFERWLLRFQPATHVGTSMPVNIDMLHDELLPGLWARLPMVPHNVLTRSMRARCCDRLGYRLIMRSSSATLKPPPTHPPESSSSFQHYRIPTTSTYGGQLHLDVYCKHVPIEFGAAAQADLSHTENDAACFAGDADRSSDVDSALGSFLSFVASAPGLQLLSSTGCSTDELGGALDRIRMRAFGSSATIGCRS